MKTLHFKWTTSRARDSYGYNVCTLYVDGVKVARCNGGGYDMKGTCLGDFIAGSYSDRLLMLGSREFYGLTFHDPDYDPGKAVVDRAPVFGGDSDKGKTVAELEKEGKSLGLERYQSFYRASSKTSTPTHKVALIDGACGFSSVTKIMEAIGLRLEVARVIARREDVYILHDALTEEVKA